MSDDFREEWQDTLDQVSQEVEEEAAEWTEEIDTIEVDGVNIMVEVDGEPNSDTPDDDSE